MPASALNPYVPGFQKAETSKLFLSDTTKLMRVDSGADAAFDLSQVATTGHGVVMAEVSAWTISASWSARWQIGHSLCDLPLSTN